MSKYIIVILKKNMYIHTINEWSICFNDYLIWREWDFKMCNNVNSDFPNVTINLET